VDQEKR